MAPKLLNIIAHDIFEAKNIEMYSSLGFEVQTTGVYSDPYNLDPTKPHLPKVKGNFNKDLVEGFKELNPQGFQYGRGNLNLSAEYIKKFDVVLFSWIIEPLFQNFALFSGIPTFYQTFGQSDGNRENLLRKLRGARVPVVRMSEHEKFFPNYAGADAVIDLQIDTNFYKGWTGQEEYIYTVNSAFVQRKFESNTAEYLKVTEDLPKKLYGTHNQGMRALYNYGAASSEELLRQFQINRLYFSLGTKPCPVVLSFKEAMSTGQPVITWGPKLGGPTFAAHTFIENGVNGFYSDDLSELKSYAELLLKNYDLAKKVSIEGRKTALKNFGMDIIGPKWLSLFREKGVSI